MQKFSYCITDELGIHARPAAVLVKLAATFESSITVEKDGKTADAKRIMALMSLGAKKGANVTITIEGSDENEAFEAIDKFFKENL